MKKQIRNIVFILLSICTTNIYAITSQELQNTNDYYLKEIIFDKQYTDFHEDSEIGAYGHFYDVPLKKGDIIYAYLKVNDDNTNSLYAKYSLYARYSNMNGETKRLTEDFDAAYTFISVNSETAEWEDEGIYTMTEDGYLSAHVGRTAGGGKPYRTYDLKLYIYMPYNRNVSVDTVYNKLGDNTNALLKLNTIKELDDTVNIFKGETLLYSSKSVPSTYIVSLDEGDSTLRVNITNIEGIARAISDPIAFNKRNVLSNILHESTLENKKIIIINDSLRYFDDNQANGQLVEKIVKSKQPVYFIGDMLSDNENLLSPMLGEIK